MKQNTAMMELIESLNSVKPDQFCSIETIKEWSQQLIEKEKQQIMVAYYEGYQDGCEKPNNENDDYYNQTYLKESKQ